MLKKYVASLIKKRYSHCSVLIGFKKGFERYFTWARMACFTKEVK